MASFRTIIRTQPSRRICSIWRKPSGKRRPSLGIAFDGDADRIGALDEKGDAIYGDMLLLIFGREILSRKPGATFIGEVKCSQAMYDEFARAGRQPDHVQDRPLADQGEDEAGAG